MTRASRHAPGLILGLSSGAVALYQSLHQTPIWDLSYILNYGYRISAGQLPYRDFPIPQAPGTFIVQGALIKVFGPHYIVQIAYTALASALATWLTYRIACKMLRGRVSHPRMVGFVLALPLAFLGIYNILPIPFYDPDACLWILVALNVILYAGERSYPAGPTVLGGALTVVPMLFKQNLGIPFFIAVQVVMLVLLLGDGRARRAYAMQLAGALGALAMVAAAIHVLVGLRAYIFWTAGYASSRRLTFEVFLPPRLYGLIAILEFGAAFVGLALLRVRRSMITWGLALPCLVAGFVLVLWSTPEPFAVVFYWPLVILAGLALMAFNLVAAPGFAAGIPLVVVAVTAGSLLSQGLVGSTYGIWPLLVLAMASVIAGAGALAGAGKRVPQVLAFGWALLVGVGAFPYIAQNVRLSYLSRSSDQWARSETPSLWPMASGGNHIQEMDQIVRYVAAHIPRDQDFLAFPGEDPLYFALGRTPRFPVLVFDGTANPCDGEEIRQILDQQRVRWILVKRRFQLNSRQWEAGLPRDITVNYRLVERAGAYDVYRRPERPVAPKTVPVCIEHLSGAERVLAAR